MPFVLQNSTFATIFEWYLYLKNSVLFFVNFSFFYKFSGQIRTYGVKYVTDFISTLVLIVLLLFAFCIKVCVEPIFCVILKISYMLF